MPGRLMRLVFLLLLAILEAKNPGPASQIAGVTHEDSLEMRQMEDELAEAEGEAAEGEAAEGEAEGEEEGEGEEGEEEEKPSTADSEVAYMLLGAVIFVVSMFYLVNWEDDDIRYYAMNIISMTMSIFSAVLMYQGINDQITRFTDHWSELHRVVIQFVHCAMYIVIMQVLIGYFSGVTVWGKGEKADFDAESWLIADSLRADFNTALSQDEVGHVRNKMAEKSVWIDKFGVEVPVSKVKNHLMVAHRRMRCWAMLLAHMSGFAAINAGAHLQAVKVFNGNPFTALLPAVINQVVLQIFFKIASVARAGRMKECIDKEGESGHKKAMLCHEAVIEAENDVSSLSLSFLTVQVIRFIITGVMPNAEGEEEPPVICSWTQIISFFAIGLVAVLLAIVAAMYCAADEEEEEEEGVQHHVPESSISSRAGGILSNSLAMVFAWILLFGTKWLLLKLGIMSLKAMIGQIVHALGLSLLCGVAVFTLDFVDDSMNARGGGEAATKAIRVIIQAIAILIGFSWEHCFDAGVADVAYVTPHQRSSKFIMGCFVCVFLVPAWRKHILTKVLAYESMKKKRSQAKKKGIRRSLVLRKQMSMSQYHPIQKEEPHIASVGEIIPSDMETGKAPKEAFLSTVKKGDKVNLVSLDSTDFVWAELNGKFGLLPKKWLSIGGENTTKIEQS